MIRRGSDAFHPGEGHQTRLNLLSLIGTIRNILKRAMLPTLEEKFLSRIKPVLYNIERLRPRSSARIW